MNASKSDIKSISDNIIIFLFMLTILLPLNGTLLLLKQKISEVEKRELAPMPDFHFNPNLLSTFPSEFELYFKDHFGFRNSLIIGHNFFKIFFLRKAELNNIILGKNNWLYYTGDGMIEDYRGLESLEPLQIKAWKINFEQKRDWLAKRGIKYLYVIAPNKLSIYPEYLPNHINRIENNSKLDQLISYMKKNSDIELLDLRKPLLEAKKTELVYLPADTHWNSKGAFLAYQQIISHLKQWFPDITPVELSSLEQNKMVLESAGNALFLNLEQYFITESVSYHLKNKYSEEFSNVEFNLEGILEKPGHLMGSRCKNASLRAIVFRDSFFNSIYPFFAENFKEAIYLWMQYDQFVMEELLKNYKPDIVLEEVAERFMFISGLAQFNVHNMIGYDHLQKGKIKEAILEYREALKLNPNSPDSYYNLGFALVKDKKLDEALTHLKMALQIYPDHEKAKETLKRTEQFLNKVNLEIADIEKGLLLSPADPNLLNRLGSLYLKKGESTRAISNFKKSLAIQPEAPATLNYLALSYAAEEDYDTAISFFKEALQYQPGNADFYYNIACMYAKKKTPKQSTEWIEKALRNGYNNWELIQSDSDLENIRDSLSYHNLLKMHGRL